MILTWATRWSIPAAAILELQQVLGAATQPANPTAAPGSEAAVQNAVRVAHAQRTTGRLFRNNTGCLLDERGVPVRFGLCNDTPAINKVAKSSDLIGITPVLCKCGVTHGVFTAYECKRTGWHFTGTDREQAQLNFGNLVVALGGIFKFVSSTEEL